MPAATNLKHPVLVLVRGLPGSGKSYITLALQKSIVDILGTYSVVVLDPDVTDYNSAKYKSLSEALTADGVDAKFHPYRFLRSRAYDGIISDKIILWNQPFTQFDGFNKTVINLQAYAADHGTKLPLLVVEVEIDHNTAQERVDNRKNRGGHGPSEDTFERFINEYESFAGKGFTTVQVNGRDVAAVTVSTIMHSLSPLINSL